MGGQLLRHCPYCGQDKPPTEFYAAQSGRRCKDCKKQQNLDSYYRRKALGIKANTYYRQYGLSRQEFLAMVEAQGGRCLICKKIPPAVLRVDHCHETGKIRGLLCQHCNTGLGFFSDDSRRLQAAIDYLKA